MSLSRATSSSLPFHFPLRPEVQAAQADQRCSAVALPAVQQAAAPYPDTRLKRKLGSPTNPCQQKACAAARNSGTPFFTDAVLQNFISENAHLLEEIKSSPRLSKFRMTNDLTVFFLAVQRGRADVARRCMGNRLIGVDHIEEALLMAVELHQTEITGELLFF